MKFAAAGVGQKVDDISSIRDIFEPGIWFQHDLVGTRVDMASR